MDLIGKVEGDVLAAGVRKLEKDAGEYGEDDLDDGHPEVDDAVGAHHYQQLRQAVDDQRHQRHGGDAGLHERDARHDEKELRRQRRRQGSSALERMKRRRRKVGIALEQ